MPKWTTSLPTIRMLFCLDNQTVDLGFIEFAAFGRPNVQIVIGDIRLVAAFQVDFERIREMFFCGFVHAEIDTSLPERAVGTIVE